MIFSTQALTTILFGGSFLLGSNSCVQGLDAEERHKYKTLAREELERRLEGVFAATAAAADEEEPSFLRPQRQRQLGGSDLFSDLQTDYSAFEGPWFDCYHTKLMTFNGIPAEKHTIVTAECDGGLFGTVTRVSETSSQTLQMDLIRLNHCFMHGMGDNWDTPCPDDRIDSDGRGDGNVQVIQQMQGIGTFAGKGDHMTFFTDRTWVHGGPGGTQHEGEEYSDYYSDGERAKLENKDTMACTVFGPEGGIVCDWEINEVRYQNKQHPGCLMMKKGKEKAMMKWSKTKCDKKGGEWSTKAKVEKIENGFSYDSFGSYYLVHDRTKCLAASTPGEYCPDANDRDDPADNPNEEGTTTPTDPDAPKQPVTFIPGCYGGPACSANGPGHGCCDCTVLTAEACLEGDPPGIAFMGTPDDDRDRGCGNICAPGTCPEEDNVDKGCFAS